MDDVLDDGGSTTYSSPHHHHTRTVDASPTIPYTLLRRVRCSHACAYATRILPLAHALSASRSTTTHFRGTPTSPNMSLAKRLFNVRTYTGCLTATDASGGGHHLRALHRLQTPNAWSQELSAYRNLMLARLPHLRLCFSTTCSEERPHLQDGTSQFGARCTATAARAPAILRTRQLNTLNPGELDAQHGPPGDCGAPDYRV